MAKKPDANAILFGSSAPSVSFPEPGFTVRFRVESQTSQHRRKLEYDAKSDSYSQGYPMYWVDGRPTELKEEPADPAPVYDPVLDITTTFSNWEGVANPAKCFGADDGKRRVFIQSLRLRKAIQAAFQEAKIHGKIVQGQFGEITFTKLGKPANKQAKPPKEYEAKWYTAENPPEWASKINESASDDGDAPAEDDNPFN